MVLQTKHRKKALPFLIGWVIASGGAIAQDQQTEANAETATDESVEEVIVTGVRASQAKAIDIKRNARNVVDSIVAEDIGKLPDTTITDSLQRITGVQISREANEGTSLNIRGMPQVLTTINGEQFLSPWTITGVGANYSDIPAGMISGADVYKSQSANLVSGGISGFVDLKTISPTSLEEGWTAKARIEASQGSRSDKEITNDGKYQTRDPDYNGSVILGYNYEGQYAFTLSGFQSSTYNANYQVWDEMRLAFLDGAGGFPGDPEDLDGDGDLVNDWYIVPTEFSARSNFMERERKGWAASFEAEINDFWRVRADVFYTAMNQYDRGVKIGFNNRSSIWASKEEGRYEVQALDADGNPAVDELNHPIGTGEFGYNAPDGLAVIDRYNETEQSDLYNALQSGTLVGNGANVNYVDSNGVSRTRDVHTLLVANVLAPSFQTTSTNQINRTAALNTNVQFDYDNEDNLRGSIRYVYAEAEKKYRNVQFEQGIPDWLWVDQNGNGFKDKLNSYNVTVDYRSDIPKFMYEADLSDAAFLELYKGYGDGSDTEAALNIFRADGEYDFVENSYFESVEFGVRRGVREANHGKFFYAAPTGRYSTWANSRIPENLQYQMRTGNEIWEKYPEWRRFDYAQEDSNLVKAGLYDNGFTRADTFAFTDFGPIEGFESGVSSLNPANWDNPIDFMNRLYPGTKTVFDPGFQYGVKEITSSIFGQLNFVNDTGLFGIPFSGDIGVRVVKTSREIEHSVVPEVLDRYNSLGYDYWNKIAFVADKETINVDFTDTLPSANINFNPHDDVVVRFGIAKTNSRNDLENLGSTLTPWYQECDKTDEETGEVIEVRDATGKLRNDKVSCIGGGDDRGDPYMKPWRATVYNSSAEWYFAENSIVGAGLFLIDIATSVESYQEQRRVIDGDGIDRQRSANFWTTSNASASDLWGFEMGYKQPFSFAPSFLKYTGIEFNYTYSKSESKDIDIEGHAFPLPSNSAHQTNLILWFDHAGFNTRLAYNWRSEEYLGHAGLNTNDVPLNIGNWLEPTGYLDLAVNYYLNDNFSFYFSGTNLTEQNRRSYAQFEDQFQSLYLQERRYSFGVTMSL